MEFAEKSQQILCESLVIEAIMGITPQCLSSLSCINHYLYITTYLEFRDKILLNKIPPPNIPFVVPRRCVKVRGRVAVGDADQHPTPHPHPRPVSGHADRDRASLRP